MSNSKELNQEELNKIDIVSVLAVFLKTIRKFFVPMIIVVLAVMLLFFVRSVRSYEPLYQSQVTFSVNTENNPIIYGGTIGDEQVKGSLPQILQSDVLKNMVKDEFQLNYFPAVLELESKASANFYVLKVTAQDAGMGYAVMQSVLKHLPEACVYVIGRIQIEVLDDSGIAERPFNYLDKRMNLVKGAFFGVLLCMFFAVIYAFTSRTIQNEEDFKKYLSVSCIAAIPKISFKKRRKEIDKHIHIHNDKVGYSFHESMRMLRARTMRIAERSGYKVIMVTSSVPGEGKSTVASNLALSLAERGLKVILVDMDMRNPSVKKVLGVEEMQTKGLSDFLEKKVTLNEVVVSVKDWGVDVIFGEEEKSDPTRLLASNRIEKMVRALKEKHQYVILDTPPAAMLADAASIARCADCAVYVVKQDHARIERIAEGMDILTFAKVPVIGAVLNGTEGVMGRYGSYHYGRYGRYGHYGHYGAYGEYAKDGRTDAEYVDVEI